MGDAARALSKGTKKDRRFEVAASCASHGHQMGERGEWVAKPSPKTLRQAGCSGDAESLGRGTQSAGTDESLCLLVERTRRYA